MVGAWCGAQTKVLNSRIYITYPMQLGALGTAVVRRLTARARSDLALVARLVTLCAVLDDHYSIFLRTLVLLPKVLAWLMLGAARQHRVAAVLGECMHVKSGWWQACIIILMWV